MVRWIRQTKQQRYLAIYQLSTPLTYRSVIHSDIPYSVFMSTFNLKISFNRDIFHSQAQSCSAFPGT